MGFGPAIRSALEAVRAATEPMQTVVTVESARSQDTLGDPRLSDPVGYLALFQEGTQQHTTADGTVITAAAKASFFPDPDTGLPPVVTTRDRVTVNEKVYRVLDVRPGLNDPDTGTQIVRNVWLG